MSVSNVQRGLRARLALFGALAFFTVLIIGLFRLQIFDHDELLERSEKNRLRVQPIVPKRGIMYDRFGEIIADNRPSYSVSIVRSEMQKDVTLDRLDGLIGFDSSLVMKRLQSNREPLYLPAVIKRDVDFEKVAILEEQYENYPGITYSMDRVRRYDSTVKAECFTGYVGEVGSDSMYSGPIKLRAGSFIGKNGLEKEYDILLRGLEGTKYLEISARGVALGELPDRAADSGYPGSDLILTIDAELQREAALMFDSFCCGAVVAIDPNNGEVLAMLSEPDYDANIFSGAIPTDVWNSIVSDTNKPLLNRPILALYPPGSPFKLVTAGALLEEGIVNEHTHFNPCMGGWQFGRRWFKCWNLGGHGEVSLIKAIAQSCDVYFYQAGLKLGINRLAEYTRQCGFGSETGIDLPQEYSGLVPTTDSLDKFYGKKRWTEGLMLNLSIGQGELLVTPLQMAQFFAGLANNGVVHRPHLVKNVITPEGDTLTGPNVTSFRLPFSEHTLALLHEGLLRVVHSEHGTAKGIAIKEYQMAGKTGTAQNPHGENHSWFVGYAPYDKPQIVVCAIVENAGHGSEVAAPIVGRLMRYYIKRQQEREAGRVASVTMPPFIFE